MAQFGTDVTDAIWKELDAFQALTTATLNILGPESIDPTTGAITQTTTSDSVDGLLSAYRREEIDGVHVTTADRKLLYPKSESPIDPNLLSTVTIASVTWEVADVQEVNNGGAWALQLRRVGHV